MDGGVTVDTDARPVWEELQDKAEKLEEKVARYFEDKNDEDGNKPPVVKAPQQPTAEEWERHQVTHTPYAPWCHHCNAARDVRRHHQRAKTNARLVRDVDADQTGPVKLSMDYMYLHDRRGQYKEERWNPPHMVVTEHRHGRVWAHRVPNKGIHRDASWLPRRIVQDLDNSGMQNVKIITKSDQEPAIVDVQTAMQELRPDKMIPTNSPIGESESNGRAENSIRRVQEKVRTLRHHVEHKAKMKIPDDAPLVAWLVRWAAELISKYSRGDDGKSPYERLRGEPSKVPLVPFGERVLYLPMKTVKRPKGEPAKRVGIWLGINERTEETLVGTEKGVIKCRTISRFSQDDAWDKELLLRMKGVPWNPVPGRDDIRVPVDITDNGGVVDEDDDIQSELGDDEHDEETRPILRGGPHRLHVSRKAVAKYGTTEGCAACTAIKRLGHTRGKLKYNHSEECRARILEEMKSDPQYRSLMEKHGHVSNEQSVEMVTDVQREEMLGHIRKAIYYINQSKERIRSPIEHGLDKAMMELLIANIEVAEVYSPPRVVTMAKTMGLKAGWSLDLTTKEVDGRQWNFNEVEMRNRAIRKVLEDQPMFLIGSPMCTAFSVMNRINYAKMAPEEVKARVEYGRTHLEFCAKLYALQWKAGRYFLHEHPAEATSWQEDCIKNILEKEGVLRVTGDQCRYGLKAADKHRTGLARKRIGFMTNSVCVAQKLEKRCPNKPGNEVHKHVRLEDGRTRAAQEYPPASCRAICSGIQEQIKADRNGEFLIASIDQLEETSSKQLMSIKKEIQSKYKTADEDEDQTWLEAYDDVSGAQLDPKKVQQARREEVDYVRKMHLYDKVPITECRAKTGKNPITVRWIDINKGDSANPNYRSRLVAREINTYKREDLFAATPPLEALKLILSMTATSNRGEIVMVNDISRAFFHAKAERDVYVQFAPEDMKPGEEGMCGKLRYSMYGTRDAAQNWYKEYSSQLIQIGFTQGIASPCTFFHKQRGIRTYVHGDDYVSTGMPNQLDWMKNKLEQKYQVKTQLLGPGEHHQKEIKIFNRIVQWDGVQGILYEADPRHVELIIKDLQFGDAKIVVTPGTKEEGRTQEDSEQELGEQEATKYRAIVARCNYLAPDRPDIGFAVKELARQMSKPTKGDWVRLKRFGRYLIGKPRLQQRYARQNSQRVLKAYSDADWAGCKSTRKSTTGGCIMVGTHAIKVWSKTQSLIALSSGESELYATLRAAAEALGVISMMRDMGYSVSGEIWSDASAALGIIHRTGLGKTRHIDTGLLWIQQTAAEQRLRFQKVLGKNNPAESHMLLSAFV